MFSGSFDLSAAEEVGSGDGIERGQVVDLLASLVDASMITVGATEGRVRYSLLETLRAYGWSHLSHQDEADTVRLEARQPLRVDRRTGRPGAARPGRGEWVTIVDRELGNLRAAHQWLVRTAHVELALRLSRGLHYYMLFRFRDEVVSWGQVTLELPGAEQHPLFAEVCGAVGEGLTARGEMGLARALADRALSHVDGPDDGRRMFGLRLSGMVSLYVGRLDDGFRDHAEMLRLARLHDHPYEAGMALLGLAQARTYAGAPEEGLAFAEEQYRVVEPLGNPSMLALAWYDQAEALSMLEPDRAIEPYQRAIGLAESAGATFVEGIALVGLASLLGRSGDPSTALPLFRSIVERWRQMGVWTHQWTTLRNLVQLLVRIGSWESAAVLSGAINAHRADAQAFGAEAERMRSATERIADRLGTSKWSEADGRGAVDVRSGHRHLRVRGHRSSRRAPAAPRTTGLSLRPEPDDSPITVTGARHGCSTARDHTERAGKDRRLGDGRVTPEPPVASGHVTSHGMTQDGCQPRLHRAPAGHAGAGERRAPLRHGPGRSGGRGVAVFDGIVVQTAGGIRFVDADQIDSIYATYVRTTLSAEQAMNLPPPDGSTLVEIKPAKSIGRPLAPHSRWGEAVVPARASRRRYLLIGRTARIAADPVVPAHG